MDVKQSLYVSSGKKSHNITDCYVTVRNVSSFLLKLLLFHISIGKSHKEFQNLISLIVRKGFFSMLNFYMARVYPPVFMMVLFFIWSTSSLLWIFTSLVQTKIMPPL